MYILQLVVTQEDINKGHKGKCTACPIALAIKRVIPDATNIAVHPSIIGFDSKSKYCKILTSPFINSFIRVFDIGGKVSSFNVELEVIEKSL